MSPPYWHGVILHFTGYTQLLMDTQSADLTSWSEPDVKFWARCVSHKWCQSPARRQHPGPGGIENRWPGTERRDLKRTVRIICKSSVTSKWHFHVNKHLDPDAHSVPIYKSQQLIHNNLLQNLCQKTDCWLLRKSCNICNIYKKSKGGTGERTINQLSRKTFKLSYRF